MHNLESRMSRLEKYSISQEFTDSTHWLVRPAGLPQLHGRTNLFTFVAITVCEHCLAFQTGMIPDSVDNLYLYVNVGFQLCAVMAKLAKASSEWTSGVSMLRMKVWETLISPKFWGSQLENWEHFKLLGFKLLDSSTEAAMTLPLPGSFLCYHYLCLWHPMTTGAQYSTEKTVQRRAGKQGFEQCCETHWGIYTNTSIQRLHENGQWQFRRVLLFLYTAELLSSSDDQLLRNRSLKFPKYSILTSS